MSKKILLLLIISLSSTFNSVVFAQTKPAEEPIVPMTLILKKMDEAGYPIVTRIELKNGLYELKGLNAHSQPFDLFVDPRTNKIVKAKPIAPLLTVVDIADRVEKKGFHTIYTLQLKNGKYKVNALDKDDKQVALDVDAKTGIISVVVPL